jgi:membrane-associated phospholipid phosphatase
MDGAVLACLVSACYQAGIATAINVANMNKTSHERDAMAEKQASMTFYRRMAVACILLLIVSAVGCALTSIHTNLIDRVIAVTVLVAATVALPAYWQHRGHPEMRDAALTLPWAVLLAAALPFPLLVAARSRLPLEDATLAHLDGFFGIHIPAIVGWAATHPVGIALNRSYSLLTPMLLAAIFIPALTGRTRAARAFLFANLIAFFIAVPLFALMPAVGPWYYFHFTPDPSQLNCRRELLELRANGPYTYLTQGAGIVCFPSFHAIWAVLSAWALWDLRRLRALLIILAGAILASTLTTGWHYFVDVAAGICVAIIAAVAAGRAAHPRRQRIVG